MKPQIRYAKNGEVNIAYTTIGDGPIDLVFVHGWVSNVEFVIETPEIFSFFEKLGKFARVILFDRAGVGMSDRSEISGALETRIDDLRAVMDAAGSERAALFGISEGGPMCALFAATYPERTAGLILFGSFAKFIRTGDDGGAVTIEMLPSFLATMQEAWGTGAEYAWWAPSQAGNRRVQELWAKIQRASASPGSARLIVEMNSEIDIRGILGSIRVPTLVLHSSGDKIVNWRCGRYLAGSIPGARYVELASSDHVPWFELTDTIAGEAEEFLTGTRSEATHDTIVSTVLFVDIVDSTKKLAELGDHEWKNLLARFHEGVRSCLKRFRGREVDTAGDGFLASFDGPARAIRCARVIQDEVRSLGVEVRAGLHTGECEVLDGKVAGIAVHIGSRVAGKAAAGDILVTGTVKDLVAGSGLEFEPRGESELKGVPGSWPLFSAAVGR